MWVNILIFVVVLALGILLGMRFARPKSINGAIRIDRSDPDDNPYLFLELNDDINKLYNAEYVTLEIKLENYISQK